MGDLPKPWWNSKTFSRRVGLLGAPAIGAALLACTEAKSERTPLSLKHAEFFSNGAVLSTEPRLDIVAYPERMNQLVTESNGGLKLPVDFVIVTAIVPTLESAVMSMEDLRREVEPAVQARFPKQLTYRKYSINFLTSQDAVASTMRAYMPNERVKSKVTRDVDPIEVAKGISNQLSINWFLSVREQFAAETGLQRPPRQLPTKIAEFITKSPPIEVVKIKGGFGN